MKFNKAAQINLKAGESVQSTDSTLKDFSWSAVGIFLHNMETS